MTGNITYYIARPLWTLAGVGNILLATTIDGDDKNSLLVRIIVILCGVITVWLSIFFGAFLKHLAEHSKDRRILFEDINNRLNEIKEAVCPKTGADHKGENKE